MNAADQGGRARSRVDAKVVELAAYRTGKDEPHVRIGRAADIPAALALAEARHQDCRLAVLPWSKSKAAALFELAVHHGDRSEEHTSELQSLMRISYAVFCLKTKKPPT